ncbi:MAG: sensor histidine kinase [Acidimicrobiales bacterium]
MPTPLIGMASVAVVFAGFAMGPADQPVKSVAVAVVGLGVLGGTWTLGRALRERRAYTSRSAEALAERAIAEERLRIAREMHDIVTHGVGLIAVKAGVANHVLAERPEEAADALRVIEAASRAALVEMRRMLGVLRSDGPCDDDAGLGPVPGLAGTGRLAEAAGSAGIAVDLDVHGAEGLPPGVELSVYRIVQEALTNVAKHSGASRCRVMVEASKAEVRVEVVDDGAGTTGPSSLRPGPIRGHGLVGMRERVALYGGEMSAGARASTSSSTHLRKWPWWARRAPAPKRSSWPSGNAPTWC